MGKGRQYYMLHSFHAGLCCVCLRAAVPSSVHVPQEEPQQESDGFLFLVQLSQIPFRATQLH